MVRGSWVDDATQLSKKQGQDTNEEANRQQGQWISQDMVFGSPNGCAERGR
jgi:hypothetical protein